MSRTPRWGVALPENREPGVPGALLLEIRLPPLMWNALTRLSGMTFQKLIKSFLWVLFLSKLLGQDQGGGEEVKIPLRMVALANVEGHLGLQSSMRGSCLRRHLRHGYEGMRRYGCGMRRYECGRNDVVGMAWEASRALNLDYLWQLVWHVNSITCAYICTVSGIPK